MVSLKGLKSNLFLWTYTLMGHRSKNKFFQKDTRNTLQKKSTAYYGIEISPAKPTTYIDQSGEERMKTLGTRLRKCEKSYINKQNVYLVWKQNATCMRRERGRLKASYVRSCMNYTNYGAKANQHHQRNREHQPLKDKTNLMLQGILHRTLSHIS